MKREKRKELAENTSHHENGSQELNFKCSNAVSGGKTSHCNPQTPTERISNFKGDPCLQIGVEDGLFLSKKARFSGKLAENTTYQENGSQESNFKCSSTDLVGKSSQCNPQPPPERMSYLKGDTILQIGVKDDIFLWKKGRFSTKLAENTTYQENGSQESNSKCSSAVLSGKSSHYNPQPPPERIYNLGRDPNLQIEVKNNLFPPDKQDFQPILQQFFVRMNSLHSETSGQDKVDSSTPDHTNNEAQALVLKNSDTPPPAPDTFTCLFFQLRDQVWPCSAIACLSNVIDLIFVS